MIQLARPMGTEEERMRMQGPLYKAPQPMQMQPSVMQQAGQMAVNKSIDKAGEAMLEKAGAKTAAAAGAAMGDPTGGIASEVAYETAMPMLKQLIGGFFNKGGYVNGPLSAAQLIEQDRAIAAEKVRAAQQEAAYNQRLRDQEIIDQKVALDRLRADQAWSRQGMELDSTLADIDYQARGLMAGPLSMANVNQVKYKQSGGKVAEEIEINYGGPLATRGV